MSLVVEPASDEQLSAAIRWLFSEATFADAAGQRFRELLHEGEFDRRGIWIAREGNSLRGAMFGYLLGGAQGAVWLPLADDEPTRVKLVEGLLGWFRSEQVRLVQAIVKVRERPRANVLFLAGFDRITQLRFLSRDITAHDRTQPTSSLTFRPIEEPNPTFGELLLRTYLDSQDIPELNGLRTGDEILAGYRLAWGNNSPKWWQVELSEQPVGALILSPGDQLHQIELTYFGLVPEARGRGYGRDILRFVLREATETDQQVVTLNVDVRNEPALRLYLTMGFREFDLREVFLCRMPNFIRK